MLSPPLFTKSSRETVNAVFIKKTMVDFRLLFKSKMFGLSPQTNFFTSTMHQFHTTPPSRSPWQLKASRWFTTHPFRQISPQWTFFSFRMKSELVGPECPKTASRRPRWGSSKPLPKRNLPFGGRWTTAKSATVTRPKI